MDGQRAGLALAAFATPKERLSPLFSDAGDLNFIDLNNLAASIYDVLMKSGDPVFNGQTPDGEFAFTATELKEYVDGDSLVPVCAQAEVESYASTDTERAKASQDAVQTCMAEHVCSYGLGKLTKCGGTFDILNECRVLHAIVTYHGGENIGKAMDIYNKPLSKIDLLKRSIKETNPLGLAASSIVSHRGGRYKFADLPETILSAIQMKSQKDIAHLVYELQRAMHDPKLTAEITAKIADIEKFYDQELVTASDPTMARLTLRDDDNRASGVSEIGVSEFGPLSKTLAIDKLLVQFEGGGDECRVFRRIFGLTDILPQRGPVVAMVVTSGAPPVSAVRTGKNGKLNH